MSSSFRNSFDLSSLPITHQAQIPASYRDEMGHMNVMWYTHLFDCAIYGFFEQIGFGLALMQARNEGGFLLESHIRYLAEVHVDDRITIRTRVVARSQKRYQLLSFMVNESRGNVAATFEVVGCHIDMNVRRMAPIPADITASLDALLEEHQKLDWDPPCCGVMKP